MITKKNPLKNTTKEERNIKAFLKLIQYAEGTSRQANPYAVTYGYSTIITDFSDHPYFTGEWKGKVLPASMCNAVGLQPGCKSTASGAYQFIKGTWASLRDSLNLPNFQAESQDKGAIELIRRRGALEDVKKGNIEIAISKCQKEWASFPGAGYNQPERSLTTMINKFKENGGELYA